LSQLYTPSLLTVGVSVKAYLLTAHQLLESGCFRFAAPGCISATVDTGSHLAPALCHLQDCLLLPFIGFIQAAVETYFTPFNIFMSREFFVARTQNVLIL
jgi:hypothetical protein